MFDGIEIDMLSLGDADCIVVTKWADGGPFRMLIDGGTGDSGEAVREFLRGIGCTYLYAVVCTHPHNDHAAGLIKLLQDKTINVSTGWMHDIRKHVSADSLRRASAGSSSQAEGVKQVVETTKELASAFASRGIAPQEPFAGEVISYIADLRVLGPTQPFYQTVLSEFTQVSIPASLPLPEFLSARSILGGVPYRPPATPFLPLPTYPTGDSPSPDLSAILAGVLSNSSVKESPTTQPFNNTSAILGIVFGGQKLLLTADAGSDALDLIPADWKSLEWMQVPHHGSDGNLSQKNIERFCPRFSYVSASGDTSHPSRAIVNGLIKVGGQVFSTHTLEPGHLWFCQSTVPSRSGYVPAVPLKATGQTTSVFDLSLIPRVLK